MGQISILTRLFDPSILVPGILLAAGLCSLGLVPFSTLMPMRELQLVAHGLVALAVVYTLGLVTLVIQRAFSFLPHGQNAASIEDSTDAYWDDIYRHLTTPSRESLHNYLWHLRMTCRNLAVVSTVLVLPSFLLLSTGDFSSRPASWIFGLSFLGMCLFGIITTDLNQPIRATLRPIEPADTLTDSTNVTENAHNGDISRQPPSRSAPSADTEDTPEGNELLATSHFPIAPASSRNLTERMTINSKQILAAFDAFVLEALNLKTLPHLKNSLIASFLLMPCVILGLFFPVTRSEAILLLLGTAIAILTHLLLIVLAKGEHKPAFELHWGGFGGGVQGIHIRPAGALGLLITASVIAWIGLAYVSTGRLELPSTPATNIRTTSDGAKASNITTPSDGTPDTTKNELGDTTKQTNSGGGNGKLPKKKES